MAQHMRLDDQDKAVLRALDDFTISADGETATIEGEMKVTMVRPAADDGARFFTYAPIPAAKNSRCGSRAHSCWNSLV
jgi:hypothetical protein